MNEKQNKEKMPLWLQRDMHQTLKEFSVLNQMTLEACGQYLLKLGICQHQLEKKEK